MKKFTSLLLSSVLLLGTVACQNDAKTSSDAPNSAGASPSAGAPDAMSSTAASPGASAPDAMSSTATSPAASTVETTKNDAQSDVRKAQLNSDIRAREERNNTTGGDTDRADGDLESEVRSKLEANIPKSLLAVDAKEGAVTVSGTVPNQQDLSKIEPEAKKIKGVKSVTNKATVAQAKTQ